MATAADIQNWFRNNPGATDAQIYAVMQENKVTPEPVAVIDGEVVGFLLGLQFPALLNANIMVGTEIAWWVEPGHRSKPIGVKLLKYIEKQAQSKKLKFWSMMCLEKLNADGLESIYERMGYKKAERTYIRLF